MATGTGTDRETGSGETRSGETILIELEVGRVERVDRPSSPWTALVIALFTALTCLGLGASAVLPRPIELAPSPLPERAGQPGTPLPTTPSRSGASADRRQPPRAIPVEASARIVTVADGSRVVRIAGQAAVTIRSLDVTLDLDPNTLNRNSHGRWVNGTITLPAGLDPRQIVVSSVRVRVRCRSIPRDR